MLCLRGGHLGILLGQLGGISSLSKISPPFSFFPFFPPPLRQQEITRLEVILQEKMRQKEELQQRNVELERKERLMKLQVGGASEVK